VNGFSFIRGSDLDISLSMKLLQAKPVNEALRNEISTRVLAFSKEWNRKPHLTVVLVGQDPASQIYVAKKQETAAALGFSSETLVLPSNVDPSEVRALIQGLNSREDVDGILIQRPLPSVFKEEDVVYWIDPAKDVDAFHPENVGRLSLGLSSFFPCTPFGVMALLQHYEVPVAGKVACVIGRSSIVGKPMHALLLQANATVIHCHSKTQNLRSLTRQADIVVVAAGKPGLVDASYLQQGAVVIDVGIHRNAEGKIVGDVDFESAKAICSAITPVPGGVGPMTISMLLLNTLQAAESRCEAQSKAKTE
jgi:methylenetetrahydrofolate dehydrogenase (NADP+)/methenyltetrahydrofolate cyclohydrolase